VQIPLSLLVGAQVGGHLGGPSLAAGAFHRLRSLNRSIAMSCLRRQPSNRKARRALSVGKSRCVVSSSSGRRTPGPAGASEKLGVDRGGDHLADPLDDELPEGMTSDQARHAHRRYWQQLKGSPAPW
jgi:hypothetical protein